MDVIDQMVPSKPVRKVLLFGKTGQGKSTIANMLVSGELLHDALFKTGDGMQGVTDTVASHEGRRYQVVDTIGLGEETESHRKDAEHLIYEFLRKTQEEYSHILSVTPAGRFDNLDKDISNLFPQIFEGAEPAFGLVVTKCNNPEKWKSQSQNEKLLQEKYGNFILPGRYMYIDFPPLDEDKEMEALLRKKRKKSLESLDAALQEFFQRNDFQYHKPKYGTWTLAALRNFAQRVHLMILEYAWEHARQFVRKAAEFKAKAMEFFGNALSALGIATSEYIRKQFKSWKAATANSGKTGEDTFPAVQGENDDNSQR